MKTRREQHLAAIDYLMETYSMSLKDVSEAAGANQSYIHQFYKYGRPQIVAEKFRMALAERFGLDLTTLAPLDESAVKPNVRIPASPQPILPSVAEMPQDVPVLGGLPGPAGGMHIDATVSYINRPPGLARTSDVYSIYCPDDSMAPRYDAGEPVFASPNRPVRVGDHVLVRCLDDAGRPFAFVRVVTGQAGGSWVFGQYSPAGDWTPPAQIDAVHRIFTNSEIFGI